MKRILISAYACSPYKGSEPGMGWNFVKCLSRYHELHIITESKFEKDIVKYLFEHKEASLNLHFYFLKKERNKKLRKIWPPSYYWFYRRWQKKAYSKALELNKKYCFDVVHQLNMIGYREPGFLWKLKKPFVWGPIGGFNITPWAMLSSMGLYGFLFYFLRNCINLFQMYFSNRVRNAMLVSDVLIAATIDGQKAIEKIWNKKAFLIPEVGIITESKNIAIEKSSKKLKICWSGVHTPGKSLNLLLDALALLNNDNIETHILGKGQCTDKWKIKAQKLRLKNIIYHGWLERDLAINTMKNCDIFIITSLSEATSTVLLEALSYGLPVIALDHCGFTNVITDECGIKIPIRSKNQVIHDIAVAINRIMESDSYRLQLAKGALHRAQDFSWAIKALQINNIYQQAIETFQ